jgi:FtsZ-interacting cell division protein ZipA
VGETHRVTIQEASRILRVSEGAVRKRVKRGTLTHDRDADGRVYVYLDPGVGRGADVRMDEVSHPERDALISEMVEELRDEVRYLREQLQQELERRSAEAERYQQIVAALTQANASLAQRLQALEAPQQETSPEPRETSETPTEEPEDVEPRPAEEKAQEQSRPRRRKWVTVLAILYVLVAAAVLFYVFAVLSPFSLP